MNNNCITCKNCDEWKTYDDKSYFSNCGWTYPAVPSCINVFELPGKECLRKDGADSKSCYMINVFGVEVPIVNCTCWTSKD